VQHTTSFAVTRHHPLTSPRAQTTRDRKGCSKGSFLCRPASSLRTLQDSLCFAAPHTFTSSSSCAISVGGVNNATPHTFRQQRTKSPQHQLTNCNKADNLGHLVYLVLRFDHFYPTQEPARLFATAWTTGPGLVRLALPVDLCRSPHYQQCLFYYLNFLTIRLLEVDGQQIYWMQKIAQRL
jgi:hypothetical protein